MLIKQWLVVPKSAILYWYAMVDSSTQPAQIAQPFPDLPWSRPEAPSQLLSWIYILHWYDSTKTFFAA